MARITIEDCLKRVPSRFRLVHMAAKRVRQIREGSEYLVSSPKNEDIVVSLREVAAGKVYLAEASETDESEETPAAAEIEETGQANEADEAEEAGQSNETDEAEETEELNEADEAEETGQANETDEAEETEETDETKEAEET